MVWHVSVSINGKTLIYPTVKPATKAPGAIGEQLPAWILELPSPWGLTGTPQAHLGAHGQAWALQTPTPPQSPPGLVSISGATWRCSEQYRLPSATAYFLTAVANGQTNSSNHLHVADGRVCPEDQGLDLSGWCRQVLSKLLYTLLQAPCGPVHYSVLLKGRFNTMGPSFTLAPHKHILKGWKAGELPT